MVHCRTLRHIARLYAVDEEDLRTFIKDPETFAVPGERALREREALKHEVDTEVGSACASLMALAAQVGQPPRIPQKRLR